MSVKAYVYALISLSDPTRPVYVGATMRLPETRLRQHLNDARNGRHKNPRLAEWLNGTQDARQLLLEEIDSTHMDEREMHWIAKYREQGADLFNMDNGGRGKNRLGKKHTPESRALMSRVAVGKRGTMKGRKFTAEHREKIAASKRGKPRDEVTRAKMKAAATGRRKTPEEVERIRQAMLQYHREHPRHRIKEQP